MTATNKKQRLVEVAVAVIHYQQRFLIAYRNSQQHQGDRYEFVGGKVEAGESAPTALCREVKEEIGLRLQESQLTKLGRISHDYGDKQVRLHVFQVALSQSQFEQLANDDLGLEGQPLQWVAKAELIAGSYLLPAANSPILAWLLLPSTLTITYPLSHFQGAEAPIKAWVDYHVRFLASAATVYCRPKADELIVSSEDNSLEQRVSIINTTIQCVAELLQKRPDINVILPDWIPLMAYDFNQSQTQQDSQYSSEYMRLDQYQAIQSKMTLLKPFYSNKQVIAQHLTHKTLLQLSSIADEPLDIGGSQSLDAMADSLPPHLPLVVSCHDTDSIQAANRLANQRIKQQQPPLIAAFISPVRQTKTHPEAKVLGWTGFAELSSMMDMPAIALGGLSIDDIQKARQHGGYGVAGIREFLQ